MGGRKGGEIASKIAVNLLPEIIISKSQNLLDITPEIMKKGKYSVT